MNYRIALLSFFILLGTQKTVQAQNYLVDEDADYSAIFNESNLSLSNTDTIPGFNSKAQKLKVTGTIYESDGVTPAKDVVLYIEQADENGDFDLRTSNEQRYVHHRGWVKTDANGQYTIYTFLPGNDRRYNLLQQLFPIVKHNGEAREMESLLFDSDPLLSKACRKKITKKGDPSRILKTTTVNDMLVAQKDIVLYEASEATK
ncbi:hypothetical protein ACU8DI_06445 [Psychroserpens sp. BH13MA-6]